MVLVVITPAPLTPDSSLLSYCGIADFIGHRRTQPEPFHLDFAFNGCRTAQQVSYKILDRQSLSGAIKLIFQSQFHNHSGSVAAFIGSANLRFKNYIAEGPCVLICFLLLSRNSFQR
jgi:hypothetical protein